MHPPTKRLALSLLVALGLLLAAALPATAKGVPYLVEVESYNPRPVVDKLTSIVVRLYAPTDPTLLLEDQELIPDLALLEIRHFDGFWVVQPEFERLDRVSFQAEFTYRETGDWKLVIHPGFTVREAIPTHYPLELDIFVTTPPPTTSSGEWEGLAAAVAFVGLLVLIVAGVTRSRWRHGTPAAPDNPGDTWWSG